MTTTDGEGSISERVIQKKSTEYEHGTTVKLTAIPSEGWEFVEWEGDISGNGNPEQINIDQPQRVTAVFNKLFYLHKNEVTIVCTGAEPGQKGIVEGIEYEAVDKTLLNEKISNKEDLTNPSLHHPSE